MRCLMKRAGQMAGLAGLAGLGVGSSVAQTLNVPEGYVWSSHIPPGFSYLTDPMIKPMVHLNIAYNMTDANGTFDPDSLASSAYGTGAFRAGGVAALQVQSMGLASGQICILIQNFGRDDAGCDTAEDASPATPFNGWFYRAEDRIGFSKSDEYLTTGRFKYYRGHASEYRSARYYRHPFLTNAGGNPNNTGVYPMKSWMREFLLGYKAQQTLDPSIPRPDKFYFDAEPLQYPNAHENSVHILKRIAQNYTIWSTWNVPGYGQTMKQLYDRHITGGAEDWGWPADVGTTAGILSLINDGNPFITGNNLKVSSWWSEMCYRAQNEVFKFSAYDVIHDPSYGWNTMSGGKYVVKCGNYNDFRADGLKTLGSSGTERVGWFQDRPNNDNTQPFPRNYDSGGIDLSVPRETLPRFAMHRVDGGYQYWTNWTTAAGTDSPRYLGIHQWASGEVDSPVLYPGSAAVLTYNEQRNYYVSGHPYDTSPFDVVRRCGRRAVEDCINSDGGVLSDRLAPWLLLSSTRDDGDPQPSPYDYYSAKQSREQLRMLRGKNVKELLFWTNVPTTSYDPYDPDWLDLDRGWSETSEMMQRVYSNHIVNYARLTGPSGLPGQPSPYSSFDTSRLEFTLTDPANSSTQEYEVEVKPNQQILTSPTRYRYTTSLTVDFAVTDSNFWGDNMYDIHLEGSTNGASVTGQVSYWDGSAWQTPTVSGSGAFSYHAPQSSDGRYRFRETIRGALLAQPFWDSVAGVYKVRLRLAQTSQDYTSPMSTFMVYYDNVQLTPIGYGGAP